MIITILIFLLILTILVLIHEAGHFFVAKKLGIKVEEFGIGFPPRLWGIKKGETIYSLNLFPIGGFVKLYGEDDAGGGSVKLKGKDQNIKDTKRAFFARPVWQRAIVVLAGVFMNFVLAVAILSYFFGVTGVNLPGDKVIITEVVKESPAGKAGLEKGDLIREVNNTQVKDPKALIETTRKYLGQEITLKVERDGAQRLVEITPRKDFPKDEGPMGIGIAQDIIKKKYPLWQAPWVGAVKAVEDSVLIVKGLGKIVFQLGTQAQVPKDVAGPIGIARLTGEIVAVGPTAILSLMALLSLNLAILNVLPIPALDGGRLFFILIEGVIGRKIPQKFESTIHAIGMAVLLALIALISLSDIINWISGRPILPQ
jgi:regulator of sigma E protease